MAYTKAMQYARLAGMLEVAAKAIVRCREVAGSLPNTDEIRGALDDMRDVLRAEENRAMSLGMKEADRTAAAPEADHG